MAFGAGGLVALATDEIAQQPFRHRAREGVLPFLFQVADAGGQAIGQGAAEIGAGEDPAVHQFRIDGDHRRAGQGPHLVAARGLGQQAFQAEDVAAAHQAQGTFAAIGILHYQLQTSVLDAIQAAGVAMAVEPDGARFPYLDAHVALRRFPLRQGQCGPEQLVLDDGPMVLVHGIPPLCLFDSPLRRKTSTPTMPNILRNGPYVPFFDSARKGPRDGPSGLVYPQRRCFGRSPTDDSGENPL